MKKLIYLIVLALILGLVLSGCLLSNVGQVPTTEQSGITYLTKHTADAPQVTTLFAGQTIEVGTVNVWNDDVNLYVKYVLTDLDWCLTETHLAVAVSLDGIPQTKKNNPIPGQFPYQCCYDEGGSEWVFQIKKGGNTGAGCDADGSTETCLTVITYTIPLDWGPDTGLFIAAHAVIEKEVCEIVAEAGSASYVSDIENTNVTDGNVGGATYPHLAVLAHKPGDPGSPYAAGTWDNNLKLNNIPFSFNAEADWIWESYHVVEPILGDVVTFEREFNIPGDPNGGTLYVACDNGFAAYLNDEFLGSANLFQYPTLGDLKQAYVDTTNWQNVQQYDLTGKLQQGNNILRIIGVNEYLNSDDGGQPEGTVYLNPGGLKFQFDVDWDAIEECTTYDESAWAYGDRFVQKGNWATYFTYIVQAVPVDTTWILTFEYLGSYYDHEMLLINTGGDLTGTGGYPVEGPPYTYPWTITSGSVSGNTIDFDAEYDPSCPTTVAGAIMHLIGTIVSPGTITNGSWTDNAWGQNRSGTWTAALVPQSQLNKETGDGSLVRPGLGRDIQQVKILPGKIIAESPVASLGVFWSNP